MRQPVYTQTTVGEWLLDLVKDKHKLIAKWAVKLTTAKTYPSWVMNVTLRLSWPNLLTFINQASEQMLNLTLKGVQSEQHYCPAHSFSVTCTYHM